MSHFSLRHPRSLSQWSTKKVFSNRLLQDCVVDCKFDDLLLVFWPKAKRKRFVASAWARAVSWCSCRDVSPSRSRSASKSEALRAASADSSHLDSFVFRGRSMPGLDCSNWDDLEVNETEEHELSMPVNDEIQWNSMGPLMDRIERHETGRGCSKRERSRGSPGSLLWLRCLQVQYPSHTRSSVPSSVAHMSVASPTWASRCRFFFLGDTRKRREGFGKVVGAVMRVARRRSSITSSRCNTVGLARVFDTQVLAWEHFSLLDGCMQLRHLLDAPPCCQMKFADRLFVVFVISLSLSL